ncbi:MAG TPA: AbrB/MazE/SpoVT family DNA-binding domain-containing protein [Gammaproteobacteria bacterium]|nr:AbrB/MazE/SpoVT family DNA-binding domain-containing protein [Gammaproteobacteria bacterium]
MSKITGKFQITLPKKLVDAYGINVGDDVELVAAGETISIVPRRAVNPEEPRERLHHFDRATERQRAREQARSLGPVETRGWTREELHTRGWTR